jgi:hypothetical protein
MASLHSNCISGITTTTFSKSHAVNKKYVDDNIPTLPNTKEGGGKFLVTTDGVSITWSDISNVEEFEKVGISTYYIPEMASSVHIEAVGAGAAGNNTHNQSMADDSTSQLLWTCCQFAMHELRDATYGDGKYLIAGQCLNPIGSTDGINWATRTVQISTSYYDGVYAVDYHNGIFLAGGHSSFNGSGCATRGAVQASTDSIHWVLRTIANSNDSNCFCKPGWGSLKYLNDHWYLLNGETQRSLEVSTDSIHWTLRTLGNYGGFKLGWSGSHYAYVQCANRTPTSSTDGIVWFARSIPWAQNVCCTCSEHAFTYHPDSDVWVKAYRTYNNSSCPSGSGYYYGHHVISSTDTIHWTLRTVPYSNQFPQGYTSCTSDHYDSVVSIGGRIYMSGRTVKNTANFPDAAADGCFTCMLYPITSTDAINWEVFTNSVKCTSPFVTSSQHPYQTTCWSQLLKVNNRLLTGGLDPAAVLSKRLAGGGDGGNSGNYALFSVDPNTVIDRKLEVNIGAGGNPSTSTDNCCGCAGGGTTISYCAQEGTTSYYFNGACSSSILDTSASDHLVLGTGDFTVEFFVKFSSADPDVDSIIDTRTSTSASDGFFVGRFHTPGHENKIELFTAGDYRVTADVTVDNNVWTHVAVVRSSAVTKMYVNGVAYSNTYSDSNNYSNNYLRLGKNTSSFYQFDGYLSGIRIDKGVARYTSDFKPPSPDVQRGNRTVFLSGVKSSIEDQTGNTTVYNTCVSLCTSTCLPEIKVCHTVLGGNSGVSQFDCSFSSMRNYKGALGQDNPNMFSCQSISTPFQPSGGGAGATGDLNETGGNSGGLRHFGSVICATGGANPQTGVSTPSAMYGTGGGGGNPGCNGAPGFRGGGGGGAGESATGGSAASWSIIMASNCKDTSTCCCFGCPGNAAFTTITESGTGANARTAVGDGEGIYSGFFNTTGITKVALVHGHDGSGSITPGSGGAWTRYVVYDLVENTGSETLYEIIKRLDTYNKNNPSWAGNTGDGCFHANSSTCFVSGDYTSGCLSEDSGHFKVSRCTTCSPDKFAIWGVNEDSDNDTQVLAAYWGDLTTSSGKADSWRGQNPYQTFWSYWGNDWHSNSCSQTISAGAQTYTGVLPDAAAVSSGIDCSSIVYMLAYGGGAPAAPAGEYPAWTLRTSGHNKGSFYNYDLAPVFGVGYAYGQWLAAGQFNSYTTSTDTIHWTSRTTGYGGGNFNFNFAYDGDSTLALGSENGRVATSTDATHWTKRTMGVPKSSSNVYALSYFNNYFLSGHQNAQLQVSTDAIHWTLRTSGGDSSQDIQSFGYGAGKYLYGNQSGQIATSTDTIHWTQRTIGATTTNIRGVTYANSQYIAAGYGARISVSTDAIHWTTRTAGLPSGVCLGEINYSNNLYHIVQNYGNRIISSTDTIHWTLRTSNSPSNLSGYTNGLVNKDSEYIAGGSSGVISYLKLPFSGVTGGKGGDGFARITWW